MDAWDALVESTKYLAPIPPSTYLEVVRGGL